MSSLAVVRSLGSPRRLDPAEFGDFEQELVDQYLLAAIGAGACDATIVGDRAAIFEFVRFLVRPVWTAQPADADRFLADQRSRGRARLTVQHKAWSLGRFFGFLLVRYQGDIHVLTGHVVVQPIDEYNRPTKADEFGAGRVPPSDAEINVLFEAWRQWLPEARKFLPAARDYLAASLWRRAGLRIQESYMLDIRDWRRDLGEYGKLHVRFGKGSRGRGPKTRLVPAINEVAALLDWWLVDVRHKFGDDYLDPDAPLLPSERRDRQSGQCQRVGDQALRDGLAAAVGRGLPAWSGQLTPHGLPHYCASSLYARGVDLKAIQEPLHVHANHIEHAWTEANRRIETRLDEQDKE